MECPECGGEMEFIKKEPDVGIFQTGWSCTECGEFVEDEDE